MILLLVTALQIATSSVTVPATVVEQRSDLALRRAWEGRQLAYRFICGDTTRVMRLRELDDTLGELLGSFTAEFGHSWRGGELEQSGPDGVLRDDIGRRDDCKLRDSFEAGMTDYQNGIFASQASFMMS